MLNSLSKLKYFYIFLKNNYYGNILKFSLLKLQIFFYFTYDIHSIFKNINFKKK